MIILRYFIADTHFQHNNILKYERHQFQTIEEHDKFIVDIIKNTVKKDDELYHLGDFSFGKTFDFYAADEFKKLPCKKILIAGNHDNGADGLSVRERFLELFDEVHEVPIFLTNRIVLSHFPIPVTLGTLYLHGHLHSSVIDSKNYVNVNIHMTDYKLYSEKKLLSALSKLQPDSHKFMYEWYAEKQVFTEPRKGVVYNQDGSITIDESRILLQQEN